MIKKPYPRGKARAAQIRRIALKTTKSAIAAWEANEDPDKMPYWVLLIIIYRSIEYEADCAYNTAKRHVHDILEGKVRGENWGGTKRHAGRRIPKKYKTRVHEDLI